ncbi:ATP-binding cassette domain-containing protein [Bacteroidales bacterium]|nr:ATP-binding cassette domain-containing protein [Bacteroidales bacterium]
MIRTENLHKSFTNKKVLNDISVEFEKGKTNLIIGQSGSGKTVLLNCLVGLLETNSGSIYYDDANFTTMSNKERKLLRRKVGMLFQGAALFDSSTVEENIRFPLDVFSNLSAKEKQIKVDFCLDRVNISNSNKLFPSEISGGMQKRVAIARAIVQNPEYLFCDEPNSGLDPKTSIVIDKLISEITHEFNITTIVNTHDMNSVMEIGEKVTYIQGGIKYWEGSSNSILHTNNEHLNEFVFASNMAQKLRESEHKN